MRVLWCVLLVVVLGGAGFGWVRHRDREEAERLAKIAAEAAQRKEITITFPEGWTIKQMGERVREQLPHITEEEWNHWTGPKSPLKSEVLAAGIPKEIGLEGYLFADTYRFFDDATAQEIARTLFATTVKRITTLGPIGERGTAFLHHLTLHEFLTLASIVEREVRTEISMRRVADIFLKRLKIGMALQADSTVNYVTGGKSPAITQEETRLDSAFNTYQVAGLPPGPISAPSLRALNSVWEPEPNNWYYFLTDDKGDVYYAVTHDQHVRNKQKYLR